MADSFKVGDAPWEKKPAAFKVGEAPWEKPKSAEPSTMEQASNMAQAAGVGAANGATLGYAPQIYGAAKAIPDAIRNTSLDEMNKVIENYKKAYSQNRDEAQAYQDKLQQENPVSYGVGTLGGAIAVPIPGAAEIAGSVGAVRAAKALESAPTLAKVAMSGVKGAGIGFAANPGEEGGLDRRITNAELGGALGAGGEAVLKGIQAAPESVPAIRRWMAAKQLGANKSQLTRLLKETGDGTTKLDQLEPYMNQNGMLNMGTTFSGVVDKSAQLLDEQGQKIGNLYKGVQSKIDASPEVSNQVATSALNGPQLATEFLAKEKELLAKKHVGSSALSSIEKNLGSAENPVGLSSLGPNATLEDLHNYRMSVDDQIPWNADDTGKLVAQSNKRLRSFLNDKIQTRIQAADDALGENNLSALKDANKSYSNAATINQIAEKTKAGEMSKYVPGLVGTVGGLGTTAYSHESGDSYPVALGKGLAVGMALRGARAVAPAITYRGATTLEPFLQGASNLVEQRPNVAAQLATPWVVMNQENKKK